MVAITDLLMKNSHQWFKQLSITHQMGIAEKYTEETDDNTDLTQGFSETGEAWIIQNHDNDIKDWILTENYDIIEDNLKGLTYLLKDGGKAIVLKRSIMNSERWKVEIRNSNDEYESEEIFSWEELRELIK